jgi:glutamyl/glutaminyl-tRNA synthetase
MIVTRFAPAPTGYLHIGHIVNAVYIWGIARAAGGRVLIRIEDHDRQRSRVEYERALFEDLEWLGFRGMHRRSDKASVRLRTLRLSRRLKLPNACTHANVPAATSNQ